MARPSVERTEEASGESSRRGNSVRYSLMNDPEFDQIIGQVHKNASFNHTNFPADNNATIGDFVAVTQDRPTIALSMEDLDNHTAAVAQEVRDYNASKTGGQPSLYLSFQEDDGPAHGLKTQAAFVKAVREHPDETFKILNETMSEAVAQQATMGALWQEVQARYKESAAFKGWATLFAGRITPLEGQLEAKNARIQQLEAQLLAANANPSMGSRSASLSPFVGSSKSEKHPDPPVFYDDPSKDAIPFKVWAKQISNKLVANHDRFPTSFEKMAYIEGRLGGTAAVNLQPYLEEGNPNQVMDHIELLQHLRGEYEDPHELLKAKEEFKALTMGKNEDFSSFKNRFVRLAGQAQLAQSEWKFELRTKLVYALASATNFLFDDPNISFSAYVSAISSQAQLYQQHRSTLEKRDKPAPSNRTLRDTQTFRAPALNSNNNNTTFRPMNAPLSREQLQQALVRGTCFNCKKPGHLSRECPEKMAKHARTAQRLQMLQLEAPAPVTTPKTVQFVEEVEEETGSEN
jgi:hypothetical protein